MNMNKKEKSKIIIVGARIDGQAGVVINVIESKNDYEVIAFIDNSPELQGTEVNGIPVIGSTDNLEDIKVPIIMMGIGWKSQKGNWEDTYSYSLSEKTLSLLDRIENSGYQSSVRDYHT